MTDFHALPPDLPVPVDDGAADHLEGMGLPTLALPATARRKRWTRRGQLRRPARSCCTCIRVPVRPGQPSPGWMGRDPGGARLHAAELRVP